MDAQGGGGGNQILFYSQFKLIIVVQFEMASSNMNEELKQSD